ncbi:MFS transporter [Amnibacterium soli]|uniref:MFS transporter n=1 Tax=Amnibacterium soli TaxID=1282736 RepID=UPI003CD062A9
MLLQLGLLVAVHDLAEVLLKPVFGALADRVGPKPVVVWGLAAFVAVSAVGGLLPGMTALILVRFGQGAAAAAFSPVAPQRSGGSPPPPPAAGASAGTDRGSRSATPQAPSSAPRSRRPAVRGCCRRCSPCWARPPRSGRRRAARPRGSARWASSSPQRPHRRRAGTSERRPVNGGAPAGGTPRQPRCWRTDGDSGYMCS